MRRGLMLLLLLLCSCGTGAPVPMATPPPIEDEEKAIYSTLIRQNPLGYDLGTSIVIRETAVGMGEMVQRTLKEADDLPVELVESYRSRNAESHTVDPSLDVDLDYTLMPQAEFEEIFLQTGSVWTRFVARYPEASGMVVFSSVGLDADGDTALVEMYYRCGDLCGAGALFLVVKSEGNWKVERQLLSWMS